MQSMKYFGWETDFKGRLILACDVRAALRYSEMGEVEASVVFGSDAIKSKKIKVLGIIPEESHNPIEFIGFRVSNSPETEKLFSFIISEKGLQIWEKHGFLPV
jgi:molybdate transport system substrate-binding protein